MNPKRVVAAALLVTFSTACTANLAVAPQKYLESNHPDRMLLIDDGGTMHLVDSPSLVRDTISGLEEGTEDTLTLPISQVNAAMVRRTSPVRTAVLVGGIATVAGLAAFGLSQTSTGGAPCITGSSYKDITQGTGTTPC